MSAEDRASIERQMVYLTRVGVPAERQGVILNGVMDTYQGHLQRAEREGE